MTTTHKFANRLLSVILCLAIMLSYLPATGLHAKAAGSGLSLTADPATLNDWQQFFSTTGNLTTEYAGGIWTDKSVLTSAAPFASAGITLAENSFLVALSAIGSNMVITGQNSAPTDTMLVLDVSGSMNDGDNNVAQDLVEAANASITALLGTNDYSRVGVVLYSGSSSSYTNNDAAVVLLPLGRYTTSDPDGQFLNYTITGNRNTTETISLDSQVIDTATNAFPQGDATEKTVVGATYIQKGLYAAMQEFQARGAATVVDPVQGTLQRKPVLVLMSDGAPTLGSTNFTAPGQFDLGSGSSTSSALGFVSQLTAAYAKQQIEAKYGGDCLFYTLSLGLDDNANTNSTSDKIACSVLNPAVTTTDINTFWTRYNTAAMGGTVVVQDGGRWDDDLVVTKISGTLEQLYVDQYFDSDLYSSDLSAGLKAAFQAVVGQIQLQSQYYPTLISQSEDVSGYVSFVDRIGTYMEVTDVKGIMIHNSLFSGADLASNFVPSGGALGSADAPTALGDELIWSIMERLNVTNVQARELVNLAYLNGQLSYTSATEFSNYLGWYADVDGNYLGFWNEGTTTAPAGSYYLMKSYGYLGEVDEAHGVSKSDMMYAVVQVRERISDGEQTVSFGIPAALLPLITYSVSLDANRDLIGLEASGATAPIRLVYQVSLNEQINPYTINDLVDSSYRAANTDAQGAISFYSNQYEADGSTGVGKKNAYSYFTPSRQNDRFYYTADAMVYADTNGTPYSLTSAPSTAGIALYRRHDSYTMINGSLAIDREYIPLTTAILQEAQWNADTARWYIPDGCVRQDYDKFEQAKSAQSTGTLPFSHRPYVDVDGDFAHDQGHVYTVGTFLGNNGKLTMTPETGLKITKAMASGSTTPTQPFTFDITNTSNAADSSSYTAYVIPASGTAYYTTVAFSGGTASVQLNPGDTIYIGGMAAGDVFEVVEREVVDYVVQSVNGAVDATGASITVQANSFGEASFVNADRGKGNLTVAKEVDHDFGTAYQIPADLTFEITVKLTGIGTANATFRARQTGSAITSVSTDANGTFKVQLKHNEQLELFDLPEGTKAEVVEENPASGFTPQYWEDGVQADGIVTVAADATISVLVVNDYLPARVYPVNITVSGVKNLVGREWQDDDVFTYTLQRQTGTDTWLDLATTTATSASKSFDFNDAFAAEAYDQAGTYYYRVLETGAGQTIDGVTYDSTVHSFSVYVADLNMDGQLEITDVHPSRPDNTFVSKPSPDEWAVEVSFTNTYAVSGTASVSIDVNKALTNDSGSSQAGLAGFTFGLYHRNADGTLGALVNDPALTPSTDRGFARLGLHYSVTDVGVHHYILAEIAPDPAPAGWTYDAAQIPVTVIVSDDGAGNLHAVIFVGTEDTAPALATASISVTFTNVYDPADAQLDIDFVRKQLSGRDIAAGEFTFEIRQMVNGAAVKTITGTNAAGAAGEQVAVTFAESLKFDKVGVYFFNVVETSKDGNGVTVDKSTFNVTVTVTDVAGVLTASYVVLNEEGNLVIFNNAYHSSPVQHTISGTKVLEGLPLDANRFTFLLTQTDAAGNPVVPANVRTATNLANGSFSFPTITYTAAGTYYYTVSERDDTTGDGIVYDTDTHKVQVIVRDDGLGNLYIYDYSIDGVSNAALQFTNRYVPAATAVQIAGTKVLEGKDLTAGSFSFKLYASDAAWNQGAELDTVENKADGSFAFAGIPYTAAGTYYYLVKEVPGSISGVVYDESVFHVQVTVTDNGLGQLIPSLLVMNANDIPQAGIEFVNRYEVSGTGSVAINGMKILENQALRAGDFTFQLFETDSSFSTAGLNAIKTALNAANGSFAFNMSYDAADVGKTFYYVVRELNAGKNIDGIVYSNEEYHVTVRVTDNGAGGIATSMHMTIGGAAVSTATFTNTYRLSGTTSVSLSGTKQLTGKTLVDGAFFFDLYETGSNFAVSGNPLHTASNVGGKFGFNLIYGVGDVGSTFYYVVRERNGGQTIDGIAYSSAVYYVTVQVTDNGVGGIIANATVTSGGNTVTSLDFVNSYAVSGSAQVVLNGTKELNGKALQDNAFTFQLFSADSSFATSGEPVATATNVGGKFSFNLAYTAADVGKTFYYVARELNAGKTIDGITYSSVEYRITVRVSDNGVGGIQATSAITLNGNAAARLDFVNTYRPTGAASVILTGTKTLTGKTLLSGAFTFRLYQTDSSFAVSGEPLSTASNKADGSFLFSLSYTAADVGKTFYYVVREANGGQTIDGIVYSANEYRITVQVTDNGLGGVHAVASITLNGSAAASLDFVNRYQITGTGSVRLEGTKVLTGKALQNNAFTFQLFRTDSSFAVTGAALRSAQNENGRFNFTLNYGASDVGKTYYYVVRELNAGQTIDGITYSSNEYRVTVQVSDNGRGGVQASATITLNGAAVTSLDFQNSYNITGSASAQLEGYKQLVGKELVDGAFTFELYASSSSYVRSGSPLATATNVGGYFTFNLTYGPADVGKTFHYVALEKNGGQTIDGIEYSSAQYHISVQVYDNGKGGIATTTYITLNGEAGASLDFVNIYSVGGTAQLVLNGTKKLEGQTLVDGKFAFRMYKADSAFNQGELLHSVTNVNGRFTFNLVYGASDVGNTYYYMVKEDNAGDTRNGITYSTSVYHITVKVTDDGAGGIKATAEITLNGAAVTSLDFVNTYAVTGTGSVQLVGNKILTGRDLQDGEFNFQLFATDSAFTISGEPIQTATNLGSHFSFRLDYSPADVGKTYYYLAKEEHAGQTIDGVTYSTQQYYITVSVGGDGKGGLEIIFEISNGTDTVSRLNFTNSYEYEWTTVVLNDTSETVGGNKILTGRPMAEGEFRFEVFATNSNFEIVGAPLYTTYNLADGSFHFPDIVLTEEGIYYYVVLENSSAALGGITYDTARYHIIADARDNGLGQLEVVDLQLLRVKDGVETAEEAITFENIYKADHTSVTLEGDKILSGRPLVEGEFLFWLQQADSSFVADANAAVLEATNGADGSFKFDALMFYAPGTYYYIITEQVVDAQRVTFDSTVYQVVIQVIDDGAGKLVASAPVITKQGSTEAVESIIFQNVFTPKPDDLSLDITVNKLVDNQGEESIGPEGFEFVLENLLTGEIQKLLSDDLGLAIFKLTFSEEDIGKTITYKLTETNTEKAYVTYSEAEFLIAVTISLDEENRLVATIVQNDLPVAQAAAQFINVYNYTYENPDTGDYLGMWIAALFVSGGVLAALALGGKKKKTQA